MYALFDWDKTLRRGFTIYDFASHLHMQGILAPGFESRMREFREEYHRGSIDHDELARKAPEEFCRGLAGVEEARMNAACENYWQTLDRRMIHALTPAVLNFCCRTGIEAVVVSGAPVVVVEKYRQLFHLGEINALEYAVDGERLTGEIAVNNGFNKVETVRRIMKERGTRPIFAMGDSSSDAPLLEASVMKLSVGSDNGWVKNRDNHYTCSPESDGSDIVEFLQRGLVLPRNIH